MSKIIKINEMTIPNCIMVISIITKDKKNKNRIFKIIRAAALVKSTREIKKSGKVIKISIMSREIHFFQILHALLNIYKIKYHKITSSIVLELSNSQKMYQNIECLKILLKILKNNVLK